VQEYKVNFRQILYSICLIELSMPTDEQIMSKCPGAEKKCSDHNQVHCPGAE